MNESINSPEERKQPLSIPSTPNLKCLGFGTGVGVYRINRSLRNGQFQSPWALKKVLRKNCDTTIPSRLSAEAEILKKLNHPNIVGYRSFSYTDDGRGCLAIEECSMSLGDLIEQEEEPFAVDKILFVAHKVASALDYLHNKVHLLHGDIKSHNILIKDQFEKVKLCDFGVCLPLKEDGAFDKKAAGKNATYIGTSLWCAPEVYCDRAKDLIITDKADIFAFGLTLWEMLALSPPHMTETYDDSLSSAEDSSFLEEELDKQLAERIGTRPAVPESVVDDDEYEDVIKLFEKCTESNYRSRFSAKDVLEFCGKN